jgi:hypothetical protein
MTGFDLPPDDCDLRDFPFMPMEVDRLRRSKTWLLAKKNPAVAFYQMNLWLASWHSLPAGSLDDDDDVLADLALCDEKTWKKVKSDALRGWVKAENGRLYHKVVAEKVIEAWEAKKAQRSRTLAARQARSKSQSGPSTDNVTRHVTENVTKTVTDNVTDNVTASKRQGQGQGQGQGHSSAREPQKQSQTPIDRIARAMNLEVGQLMRRPAFQRFPGFLSDWVAAGCDPERDVWPTIERVAKGKTEIASPKFFDLAILEARDKRIASEPSEAERWTTRIGAFFKSEFWDSKHWGPNPDEPGCLAPPELVDQLRKAKRK